MVAYAELWAKRSRANGSDSFHPLNCHLIDVGTVAGALWDRALPLSARRWFAQGLGIDEENARAWISLLAGLHDIGKASKVFQHPEQFVDRTPHGTISSVVLPDILRASPFELQPALAKRLATVIGGHHGIFPTSSDIVGAQRQQQTHIGKGDWRAHRTMLVNDLVRALAFVSATRPTAMDNARAMWLAGLISVADWIGSNTEFFPFAVSGAGIANACDLEAYAERAARQARMALQALGWNAWPVVSEPRTFEQLFPGLVPNDLQHKVSELTTHLTEPGIVIVEAPMGEGKTEAALLLADHGNALLGMRGHYLALPTMATSTAMFRRDRDFLARRYPDDLVQVQLQHGHAALSEEFDVLKDAFRASFLSEIEIPPDAERGFDDAPAGVVASTWFTYRKRGLLAPFGIGTVDQLLLAVLQTKHVFVRLFGLAGKTVVVDEVHAYDTYMSTLLERVLSWLAALDCTVVLLSATLPRARRERLVAAYQRGRPERTDSSIRSTRYPSLTWSIGEKTSTSGIETSDLARKHVHVCPVVEAAGSDRRWLGERLAKTLEQGGCAAVICNTVRSAQETYLALKEFFPGRGSDEEPELDLLHARFLYADRETRERRALKRFGKPDASGQSPDRPHRAVLVATQVIEQSLDLDFDLMVTELAPVDLVLQRLGRLHRHRRQARPTGTDADLWLVLPSEADGVPVWPRGVTHVYDEHVLLRSWLALRGRDTIAVPDDVAELIETVYDDTGNPASDIPGEIQSRWTATSADLQARREREQGLARRLLVLPPVYDPDGFLEDPNRQLDEDDPSTHHDLQALTRLGDLTVTTICLRPEETEEVQPTAEMTRKRTRALMRRSVTVSSPGAVQELVGTPPPASWSGSPLLRHCRLVRLDGDGRAVIGSYELDVTAELGVRIRAQGGEG